MTNLIDLLRNGALDLASAQVGTVGPGAVGLVRPDPIRPGAWTSPAQTRHSDLGQDRGKLGRITPLTGSEDDRERLLPGLDRQVDLGSQSAAGAPQPVVGRLAVHSARFLPLQIPLCRAPAAC